MDEFEAPHIPRTVDKRIRFLIDVVEAVEKAIQGRSSNFSAFVAAAIRMALEDMEKRSDQPGRQEAY